MNGFWWECGMFGSSTVSDIDPIAESFTSDRSVKGVGNIKGLAPAGPGVVAVHDLRGKNRLSFINIDAPKNGWTNDRELLNYRSVFVAGPWVLALFEAGDGKPYESVAFDARETGGKHASLSQFGKWAFPMNPEGKAILMDSGIVLDLKTGGAEAVPHWPAQLYGPAQCFGDGCFSARVSTDEYIFFSSCDGREIARCDMGEVRLRSLLPDAKHCEILLHKDSMLIVRLHKVTGHYAFVGYDLIEQRIRWQVPHIASGHPLRSYDVKTLDGKDLVLVGTPMPGTVDDRSSDGAFVRACNQYAIIRINVETGVLRATPLQGPIWDRQMLRPEGHLCLRGYTATLSDSLDRDAPQQWVMELYRNADGAKVAERWFKGYAAACVWRDQVVVANGNRLEILARQEAPA